jgi:hypothetical protein
MGSATDVGRPLPSGECDATPVDRTAVVLQDRSDRREGIHMLLATTTVEDVDRFLDVFGTKGAEKRALHGSKGSTVFRDPNETNRLWAIFDWDEQGWAGFVSDPDVPPILAEAGHLDAPQAAVFLGTYDA